MSPSSAADTPAAAWFYTTLRRIREAAATAPLLLALDDLHAADPDSLTLVHLLGPRLARLLVALVATIRPWPEAALRVAEELFARGLADVERLPPLSESASRSLVRGRAGTEIPAPVLERTLAMCAGNPLLLERAADRLRHDDAAGAVLGQPDLRLLLTRFLGVGEDERRLLQAASVLGARFRTAVAGQVAGLSDRQTIAALEGLTRSALIADGGGEPGRRHRPARPGQLPHRGLRARRSVLCRRGATDRRRPP